MFSLMVLGPAAEESKLGPLQLLVRADLILGSLEFKSYPLINLPYCLHLSIINSGIIGEFKLCVSRKQQMLHQTLP